MPGVLTGFAVVAAVVGVGWLVGRRGLVGPDGAVVLSRVAFFVATPALLFQTVAHSDVLAVLSSALVVTVVGTAVVAAVFVLVARLAWRRPTPETTIGALAASYVNAANIGIPIAVYVLGDATVVVPIIMFQLLVITPVAFVLLDPAARGGAPAVAAGDAATTGGRETSRQESSGREAAAPGRRSLTRVMVQQLTNPIIVACALGVVCSLTGWLPPEAVLRPVELVGAMAVPATLLAYGLSLHGAPRPGTGDTARDVWLAVFLKAVGQPLVAYLVARYLLDLSPSVVLACTVTAALPTAQNVFVYAVRYDRGVTLARDAVLLSTVSAVPVLIAVALLVG
ncbi:hypothetical protein GA0074692_3892 [Micromonospora pallida]|uniref:AEC family transporter n=1 Tax=Micromonospora pallida TaxID=145854 RepID=A0A1C6SYS6_9ACTN|nr:AEC family transporter [Micromonospora pallida]SCL34660.1 hypothetical protein GA0074692_3892 [Micromonospora pallida]